MDLNNNSIFGKLLTILNAVASIWVFVLMLTIGYDVTCRVFFNSPLPGTPEIVANSVVAIAFLQFPYVLMVNRHVSTNIFYDRFSPQVKKVTSIVGNLAGVVIFSLLLKPGWTLFLKAYRTDEWEGVGGGFHFPIAPIRFIVVLGSLMLAGEFIRRVFLLLKNKEVSRGGNFE